MAWRCSPNTASRRVPICPITVTVSQSGDYGASTGSQTVTIPASGSATLTVSTTDDNVDEPDGSVTLTVNTGSDYTVSSTQGAATVAVSDNDDAPTPVVSITGGSGITEGGDATFTVTASPAPAADLAVSVTVSQSGDYGATTGQRTVTVPTSGSVTFTVGTTDDNADETDGSVTATLVDGADYDLGASKTATVTVADNDDATPDYSDYQTVVDYLIQVRDNPANTAVRGNSAHIRKWNSVLSAIGYTTSVQAMAASQIHDNAAKWPDSPFHAASVYLTSQEQQQGQLQQQTPEVSITGGGGVTEGGDATFTVTASPAPASSLAVSVTVSQSGDYGAATGQRTVTIPTSGSVTFTVGTTDDSADEPDGSVTATVNADSGYTVSSSQGAATVAVSDNDAAPKTVVSVSAGSGITEGGSATFTVTASPAPASNLDVKVTVTQSGDYGATTGQRTVTVPTTGSVTFTVGTADDQADEPDGSITVTLNTGSGYSGSGSATVAVSDDDDPPPPVENADPPVDGALPDVASLTACEGDPELLISSPTASRSDASVDFTVMLSCIPGGNPMILMTAVRDGVIGQNMFISLSKTQLSTTVTVDIGSETELGLALVWSSGLASREAQGDVVFTD